MNLHAIHPFAHLHVWHRLLLSSLVGVIAGSLLAWAHPSPLWETYPLFAWLMAGTTYLSLLIIGLGNLDASLSRWRAQFFDPGARTIYTLLVLIAWLSIIGVLILADAAKNMSGVERWAHIALGMASLMVNWLLIQAVFALHYARMYYAADESTPDQDDVMQGIIFPGGQHPSYTDFAYFALVIGMTAQTADVSIADTRIRRQAMLHGLTSFAYNIVVLAITLNIIAGAVG